MDAISHRDGTMKRAIVVALGTGAIISSAAAIGIGGAPEPSAISLRQYQSALAAVDTAREGALARCESRVEEERDVCRAEAEARARVRAAEIETEFRRDEQSARELQRTRIDARYQVDRARCAGLSGFKREKCVVRAHADKGRAMLEAAAPYRTRYTP